MSPHPHPDRAPTRGDGAASTAHPDSRTVHLLGRGLGLIVVSSGVIWVVAMWTTNLELGAYGIVTTLSPLWYLAAILALGSMAIGVATRQSQYACAGGVLVAMFIALPTFILEKTPRFPYIFDSHAYADQLSSASRIDYAQTYMAWPGWHVVSASTVAFGHWPVASFLQWISLPLAICGGVAGVMLLLRIVGSGGLLWATLIASIPLGGALSYPLPATMATLLWVLILVLASDEAWLGMGHSAGRRLLMLLLVAGVTVTHLLTTMAMLISLVAITAGARFFGRQSWSAPALLFGTAFALSFLFYIAVQTTAQLLPAQIATILSLERLFGSSAGATSDAVARGSVEHTHVALIRIGHVVVTSALAACAIAHGVIARRVHDRSWWFSTGLVATGVATVVNGPYGGEVLSRAYGYSSFGVGPLIGRLLDGRRGWLIAPLLVLALFLAPIRAYGNEYFDHVRPQELAADDFILNYGPEAYQVGGSTRTLRAH
jgi:hypothetical protein